jgi:type VI secretion system secreted protein Hcp
MAFDAFLKIETIPGESTDAKHEEWIEILSYQHGVSQPASGSVSSGGARTAERCNHENFKVVKALDKASPKLALACCNGEHIKEVTVELCRATKDKTRYMQYKMSDVIVAAANPTGDARGEEALPSEEVSFNYARIEWTYTLTDHKTGKPAGDISAHWDRESNTGG